MNVLILGAGMMGRAIAYDLCKFSQFDTIVIADSNKASLISLKNFLTSKKAAYLELNVEQKNDVETSFRNTDIVISAIPYQFNFELTKTAMKTKTHFLDLGGNNRIVDQQRSLFETARKKNVTVIPDCGLAPGLTSVITRDIVEQSDSVDSVKIRVGGLPVGPKPPLNYQIVFSPYGLINEYVEDAVVLDHGTILKKKSMTELETVEFPKPFGKMEAFFTSGGCSTLPYTYKDTIGYLDYKTIRYPGHCEKFKTLLELGLGGEKAIRIQDQLVVPRDFFAQLLLETLPHNEKDVVLVKVKSEGEKKGTPYRLEYTLIDYYDEKRNITAMMRTTGYSVSITAQMIEQGMITKRGVFCSEEIVPCQPFFGELEKRGICISKQMSSVREEL